MEVANPSPANGLGSSTAELVRSLQSAGFSIDKIRTAIQILSTPSCFIPRKSAFFLDWISNVLIRTSDKHKPNETTEQTDKIAFLNVSSWAFFNHVSAIATSEALSPTSVVIHPRILNALSAAYSFLLSGALNDEPRAAIDISIPHKQTLMEELERTIALLLSPEVSSVSFRPSLEDVAKFVSDLASSLRPAHSHLSQIYPILASLLQVLLDVMKQQANTRKVFSVISAPRLLENLLQLYLTNDMFKSTIERIIDVALFNQSVLPEFASYFAAAAQQRRRISSAATPPASKRRKLNNGNDAPAQTTSSQSASFSRQLFETLSALTTSSSLTLDHIATGFGLLYDRYLNACSALTGRNAKRVAAISTETSDPTDAADSSSTTSSSRLETSLEFSFLLESLALVESSNLDPVSRFSVTDKLLENAAKGDIYKLAALDERSESLQRVALENIVSQLFTSARIECIFSSLRSIVLMNHLIVEPHLHRVLVSIWSMKGEAATQAATDAAASFVIALFETYGSLRQFDELLKKISACLREWDSSENVVPWFFNHPLIWKSYHSVVESLPPGQLAPIWQFFADELYENYVVTILAAASSDAMDVDNEPSTTAEARLPCIVAMFSAFIESVQLLAEAQATLLHNKLEDTINTCITPLMLPVLDTLSREQSSTALAQLSRDYVHVTLFLYVTLLRFDSFCRFRFLSPADSDTSDSGLFALMHSDLSLLQLIEAMKRADVFSRSARAALVSLECCSFRIQELFKATRAIAGANIVEIFQTFNKNGNRAVHASAQAEMQSLIQFMWNMCISDDSHPQKTEVLPRFFSVLHPDHATDLTRHFWSSFVPSDLAAYVADSHLLSDHHAELLVRFLFRDANAAVSIIENASFWEIPRVYELLGPAFLKEVAHLLPASSASGTFSKKKSSKRRSEPSSDGPSAKGLLLSIAQSPEAEVDISTISRSQNAIGLTSTSIKSLRSLLSLAASLPCWKANAGSHTQKALRSFLKGCLVIDALLRTEEVSARADALVRQMSPSKHASTDGLNADHIVLTRRVAADLFRALSQCNAVTSCSVVAGTVAPDSSFGESSLFFIYLSVVVQVALQHQESKDAESALKSIVAHIASPAQSQGSPAPYLVSKALETICGVLETAEQRAAEAKAAKRRARKHIIRDEDTENHLAVSVSVPTWCLSAILQLCTLGKKTVAFSLADEAPYFAAVVVELARVLSSPNLSASDDTIRNSICSLANELHSSLKTHLHDSRALRALAKSVSVPGFVASLEDYSQLLMQCYRVAIFEANSDALLDLFQNSSAEQLHLVLEHAATELGSKQPLQSETPSDLSPMLVTLRSLLALFDHVDRSIRYQLVPSHSGTLITSVVTLLAQFCSNNYTSTTLDAARVCHEAIILCLSVLTRVVSDKFVSPSPRQLGSVIQSIASATSAAQRNSSPFIERAQEWSSSLFVATYKLLWSLLKYRASFVFKCIAAYLMPVKGLMKILLKGLLPAVKSSLDHVAAENVARLLTELAQNTTVMKKCSIYIVVEYLRLVEFESVDPRVRQALLPGIFALLDICSDPEYNQIHKALDETGKVMFKSLLADYRQDFKFKGKV